MMSIDEAIAHAREVASEQKRRSGICVQNNSECDKFSACLKCSEEHEQLAEWLEDYRRLLEFEKSVLANEDGYLATMCERIGYNKAIDDFADKLIRYVDCGHLCSPTEVRWSDLSVVEMVKKLAEQLKAGGKNV